MGQVGITDGGTKRRRYSWVLDGKIATAPHPYILGRCAHWY